jgi:glucose/arabinose dehydrogenase
MFQAVDAVVAARRPGEAVLLDRDLRDIKHEGGGTAFRSLRFLLAGVDIDDRSIESAVDYGRGMVRGSSALLVMDARSFGRFNGDADRLRAIGVDAQPVAAPPGSDGYGVYRLERPAATASSAPIGPRGFSTYATGAPPPPDPATAEQQDAKVTSTVPVERFASGLLNPRGLAFRSDGSLFVAVAGSGGPNEVDVGREKPHHYGRSGQIVRIAPDGSKFLMAKDLPSIVTAVNEECGPSAIAFIDDRAYLLLASGGWEIGDPAFHSGVYELQSDGSLHKVWDMTEYVLAHPARARREDPRADVPAGMAYGMAAMGGKLYVTDANQEQLFEVDPASGEARQVVEYPKSNRAMTGVAAGPDGAIYVAEWASSKVTRITLDGQIGDGATKLRVPTGVTFGPDGAMYVVEFTGRVLRSAPVGQEQKDILVDGLRAATAIAFGPDGNLYVSVFGQGASNGEGEIVRVRLAPPSAAEETGRWVRGATWAAGLVVLAVMLLIGWRFREKPSAMP